MEVENNIFKIVEVTKRLEPFREGWMHKQRTETLPNHALVPNFFLKAPPMKQVESYGALYYEEYLKIGIQK